jgi:hypothetical protein
MGARTRQSISHKCVHATSDRLQHGLSERQSANHATLTCSLSRKAGIDPKLVADQLGHGLGANLDVYTIAGLDQRLAEVNTREQSMVSTAIN